MVDGIVFDIETGPLPMDQLIARMPEFEAPDNYKNQDKIDAYIQEKESKWIEKAACDALTGEVLAIGFLDEDGYTVIDQRDRDESQILMDTWNVFTTHYTRRFIGFDIFRFDLPFLFRRSMIYGIQPPTVIRNQRYWDHRFIDLHEVYKCGNREQSIGLSELHRLLGGEGKPESGADFHKWFRDEPAKAIAYLKHDLDITAQVAERLLPWIETPKAKEVA